MNSISTEIVPQLYPEELLQLTEFLQANGWKEGEFEKTVLAEMQRFIDLFEKQKKNLLVAYSHYEGQMRERIQSISISSSQRVGEQNLLLLRNTFVAAINENYDNLCQVLFELATKYKKKPKFNAAAKRILNDYWQKHLDYPYPTADEKRELATLCELSFQQVSSWFDNKRTRSKKKGLLKAKRQNLIEDISFPVFSQNESWDNLEEIKRFVFGSEI